MQPLQDDDNQTLSLLMTGTYLNQQFLSAMEEETLQYSVLLIEHGNIQTAEDFIRIIGNQGIMRDRLKLAALTKILLQAKIMLTTIEPNKAGQIENLINSTRQLALDLADKQFKQTLARLAKLREVAEGKNLTT